MDHIDVPPAPWRRPMLIVSGISLLSLGVFLNADRLGLGGADGEEIVAFSAEREMKSESKADAEEGGWGGSQRHRGEEGKMGRPASRAKSGLYAMRGPEQEDGDAWGGVGGTGVGSAFGVGGLGLVGTGRGGGGTGIEQSLSSPAEASFVAAARLRSTPLDAVGEGYGAATEHPFVTTSEDPKSTFSIDVDTASYSNVRRFLLRHATLPPVDAVRTEELVNYFDYAYAEPEGDAPFAVTTEVGPAPWNPSHQLVHIGIRAKTVGVERTPPRNLVFLVDVSGSMATADKLPLVQAGLHALTDQMGPRDRISLVAYAGTAGAVLEPTRGDDAEAIHAAIDRLGAGGGTNGAGGIHLAYRLARRSFIRGGINRVILATDGDFNVGVSDHDALVELIEKKRRSGVFLSVLGVGTGNLQDHLMEQLADEGNGNYAYLDGEQEARKVLVEQSSALLHTIAKDVKIQVHLDPEQVAQHRLIGYENRVLAHRDFDDDTKDAGEMGAGHTVTALYEIVPSGEASGDPLLTLDVRYKAPDGESSEKLSFAACEAKSELSATSEDYRFAAAVAMFGEKLHGNASQEETSYGEIAELASGALGQDPSGLRHELVQMLGVAATLAAESASEPTPRPRAAPNDSEPELEPEIDEELRDGHVPPDFVLEVLRLLPPLLALPLFVLAFRRPRKRSL